MFDPTYFQKAWMPANKVSRDAMIVPLDAEMIRPVSG